MDAGNLIFGSSAFSKSSLYIWKFSVMYYRSLAWRILSITLLGCEECNCAAVWTFFGTALCWDWNENWPFPVLSPLLSFPNLLAYWVKYFHSIILWDLKYLSWSSITFTSFICSNASLRLTWLHTPGCLALGEWSHHHGYQRNCIVSLCLLPTSS